MTFFFIVWRCVSCVNREILNKFNLFKNNNRRPFFIKIWRSIYRRIRKLRNSMNPSQRGQIFFKKFLLLLEMMYTKCKLFTNIMHSDKKKIDEIIRLFFTNIPGFRTTAYINDIIIVTSIKPKTFLGFWNSGFRWSKCKIRHLRKCTIFNPSPISFHNITSSNWIMVTYNSVTIWIVMYLNSANYIFDEYYVSIHLNIRY